MPPLYLHSSLHTEPRGRLSESGPEVEWEHRMAQVSRNQARTALNLHACATVDGTTSGFVDLCACWRVLHLICKSGRAARRTRCRGTAAGVGGAQPS